MASALRPRPLASLPVDKLSTGCPNLDAVLNGGLPCGSLTEVAGGKFHASASGCLAHLLSLPPLTARRPPASHSRPAGEAAASKTQLCLQLLLTAQLPREYGGLGGSAVYVHTEGEPALKRLHQLARCLPLR